MLFLRWFKLVYICVNALAHVGQRFSWHTNSLVNVMYVCVYIYNINWFFITRSEGRDYTLWINEEKISCHQCNKITGTNFEVPSKTNGNRSALWDHSGQIFSGKTQEKASVSKAVIFHLFYFTIDSIIVTHSFLWFNIQLLFHFLVFWRLVFEILPTSSFENCICVQKRKQAKRNN